MGVFGPVDKESRDEKSLQWTIGGRHPLFKRKNTRNFLKNTSLCFPGLWSKTCFFTKESNYLVFILNELNIIGELLSDRSDSR